VPTIPQATLETATFAAGCFWGSEKFFLEEFQPYIRSIAVGTISSRPGYIGGTVDSPTYEAVSGGNTGHAEAVQLEFVGVDYSALVKFFFRFHDPTTLNRQANDRGTQYRSAIFYHSPAQQEAATAVMAEVAPLWLTKTGRPIATALEPAGTFWKAGFLG
jgi:peptide-methionine (S)-S-oxide reductase